MAVLAADAPEPALESIRDVTALLGRTIYDVLKGRVDPRVANAVGYLAGTMIRGIEQGELERRLAELEGIVRAQGVEEGSAFDMVPSGARVEASEEDDDATETGDLFEAGR